VDEVILLARMHRSTASDDAKILKEMFGSVKQYRLLCERIERKRRDRRIRKVKPKLSRERPRATHERPPRTTHDYPYLKPIDIPSDGSRDAVIIRQPKVTQVMFDDELKERHRCAIQFINGEKRRWTMAPSAFKSLLHVFGANELAWIGKGVRLTVRVWKLQGKPIRYVSAEPLK
jgi:hypothetical protein